MVKKHQNTEIGTEIAPGLSPRLKQDLRTELRQLVQTAISSQRESLVDGLVEYLQGNLTASPKLGEEWIEIHSLSKLRSLTGGKFANLKRKWLGAGLPLRENRSDRTAVWLPIHEGWVELAQWVLEQGYEARISQASGVAVFEVRKRPPGHELSGS